MVTKEMNSGIVKQSQNEEMSFDVATRLNEQTNDFFSKYLSKWLINDKLASQFVFDLNGFDFLLDTIGVGKDEKSKKEESKEVSMRVLFEDSEPEDHVDD